MEEINQVLEKNCSNSYQIAIGKSIENTCKIYEDAEKFHPSYHQKRLFACKLTGPDLKVKLKLIGDAKYKLCFKKRISLKSDSNNFRMLVHQKVNDILQKK